MRRLLILLLFQYWLSACSTLNVLAVLPFPMKSHQIIFNTLLAELVRRGHYVTVYSNTPLPTNATNYKHIRVGTSFENTLVQKYSFENIKSRLDVEAFIRPNGFQVATRNFTEEVLNLPQIKDLLLSKEEFDVVILETYFGQEALIGFGYKFKAPVVTLTTFGSFALIDSLTGNPNPLAYVSTYLLPFTSDLSFYQRLKNFIASLSELYFSYYDHLPFQQDVMERHFQRHVDTRLPPIVDLLNNISVVLLNTQPEVSYARPWVPNMIPVGGLHISANTTTLPKDIEQFLDGTDEGFIYFSLGSTFSGDTMPGFMKAAFVAAFKRIPQRVIWKIDVAPSDLPSNVKVVEWAPQADMLADSRCRGFISHGGLLSVIEAAHFGVPIIGVPVFGDQPWNIAKVAHAEIGVYLRVLEITPDSVFHTLREVIYNNKYKRNMQLLSAQIRDKPLPPLATAAYWVEYVGRHRGAVLLQSPARRLSTVQNLFLDIILLMVLASLIVISLPFILLRLLLRLFIKSNLFFKLKNRNKVKNE